MDWREVVQNDILDLEEKIESLREFLDSEKVNTIKLDHKNLLELQIIYMESYYKILIKRSEDKCFLGI
jgi:hypothetical protein